ncbi:MAG: pilus assembly protein PilP [Gammaproteobacteria bacterium]|nr:pilus assembly protein PilP [Gammaproteobacteria bacterium]
MKIVSWRVRYLLLFGVIGLSACGNGPDSDLQAYVAEVKQNVPVPVVEKKVTNKHELFAYQADSEGIRDPFMLSQSSVALTQTPSEGVVPEEHERAILETMPLDSLVYMGNIEKRGRRVALVRSADGKIHQVQVGSYLGQNHGKVVEFDQYQITLRELLSDGLGGWHARTATVGQAK